MLTKVPRVSAAALQPQTLRGQNLRGRGLLPSSTVRAAVGVCRQERLRAGLFKFQG